MARKSKDNVQDMLKEVTTLDNGNQVTHNDIHAFVLSAGADPVLRDEGEGLLGKAISGPTWLSGVRIEPIWAE